MQITVHQFQAGVVSSSKSTASLLSHGLLSQSLPEREPSWLYRGVHEVRTLQNCVRKEIEVLHVPSVQGRSWRRRLLTAAEVVLPSGVGVAVGLYVSPKWTIPRLIGSLAEQVCFGIL